MGYLHEIEEIGPQYLVCVLPPEFGCVERALEIVKIYEMVAPVVFIAIEGSSNALR